jgi:hypothetical protein
MKGYWLGVPHIPSEGPTSVARGGDTILLWEFTSPHARCQLQRVVMVETIFRKRGDSIAVAAIAVDVH